MSERTSSKTLTDRATATVARYNLTAGSVQQDFSVHTDTGEQPCVRSSSKLKRKNGDDFSGGTRRVVRRVDGFGSKSFFSYDVLIGGRGCVTSSLGTKRCSFSSEMLNDIGSNT